LGVHSAGWRRLGVSLRRSSRRPWRTLAPRAQGSYRSREWRMPRRVDQALVAALARGDDGTNTPTPRNRRTFWPERAARPASTATCLSRTRHCRRPLWKGAAAPPNGQTAAPGHPARLVRPPIRIHPLRSTSKPAPASAPVLATSSQGEMGRSNKPSCESSQP
jgi:hypothetical protein